MAWRSRAKEARGVLDWGLCMAPASTRLSGSLAAGKVARLGMVLLQ
jgi:hypothetical protein